jgi:general secretion pathway protein F
MPVYRCRVADANGRVTELLREAPSRDSCVRDLAAGGPFVLSLQEVTPARAGRGASRDHLSELTELLALTLGSGLSLTDSLEVALSVFPRGGAAELVGRLLALLRKGGTLASALEAAGGSVPGFYTGMVRVGERIGSLDAVFARLSLYLKEEKALRDRFISALIYPCLVLAVAAASACFIAVFLLPRLHDVFNGIEPGMSTKVDALLGALQAGGIAVGAVLACLLVTVVGIRHARRRSSAAAVRVDAALLALPLVGTVGLQRDLLSFTFAMEALTGSGVSVEEALHEAGGALRNHSLKAAVNAARDRVLKGDTLSSALAACPAFPGRIARWMAIGERVGHVEKVFGQLRAYYQQEVDKWITRLMALVEPALIVGIGICVILFVVLFIVPVFSLFGAGF